MFSQERALDTALGEQITGVLTPCTIGGGFSSLLVEHAPLTRLSGQHRASKSAGSNPTNTLIVRITKGSDDGHDPDCG